MLPNEIFSFSHIRPSVELQKKKKKVSPQPRTLISDIMQDGETQKFKQLAALTGKK